jgi:hypothetical protein
MPKILSNTRLPVFLIHGILALGMGLLPAEKVLSGLYIFQLSGALNTANWMTVGNDAPRHPYMERSVVEATKFERLIESKLEEYPLKSNSRGVLFALIHEFKQRILRNQDKLV